MFGLDLYYFSPQLVAALEIIIIVLMVLILFLLVLLGSARTLGKLVRPCLQDGRYRSAITAGQRERKGVQDSTSETERDRKMGAQREKKKEMSKQIGPSKDTQSEEAIEEGKYALGEKRKERKAQRKKSLYPEDSSESEKSSSERDSDLITACYEGGRSHPGERLLRGNRKRKQTGSRNGRDSWLVVPSRPVIPSAPLLYADRCCSDSFLSKEDKGKIQALSERIEKSSFRKKQKKRWPETERGPPGHVTPVPPLSYDSANSGRLGLFFLSRGLAGN